MPSSSLRIFLHDYAGHPPQVHVSRELARRGHTVLHAYATMSETPRGKLARQQGDPPGFEVIGVGIDGAFHKHSYFKRQLAEIEYGYALARVAAAFAPDIVIASNTPLFPLNSLRRLARHRSAAFVFWMMDVYGLAVRDGLAKKLPILGGSIGRFYTHLKNIGFSADACRSLSEGFGTCSISGALRRNESIPCHFGRPSRTCLPGERTIHGRGNMGSLRP
jgi:hypothetical protein